MNFSNSGSVHSVTASQHAQRQGPGAGSPEWIAAMFNVINYTCTFPAMTNTKNGGLESKAEWPEGLEAREMTSRIALKADGIW